MRFKEQSMTGIIFDTKTNKDVGCYDVRPLMNELSDEIELLEKKLKGLEDIDEDKANLRDIAQKAIEYLVGYNMNYEANELQAELDAEMKG